jgi:hypothetical protein
MGVQHTKMPNDQLVSWSMYFRPGTNLADRSLQLLSVVDRHKKNGVVNRDRKYDALKHYSLLWSDGFPTALLMSA